MTRPECGTHAAVMAHRRHNEPVDEACRAADAEYCAQWRQANPTSRLLTVRRQNAKWRAMQRLAGEYPDHFRRFRVNQQVSVSPDASKVTQKRRAMRDMARSFPTRYAELVQEEMSRR